MPGLEDRLVAEVDLIRATVLRATRGGWSAVPHEELTSRLTDLLVSAMLTRPGDDPGDEHRDPEAARRLGAAYARRRLPLAAALGELQLTAVTTSQRWWAVSSVADAEAMFALGRRWTGAVQALGAALEEGYCAELAAAGARGAARHALALELLSGRPVPRSLVRAAGVRLSARYAVLCCMPRVTLADGPGWDERLAAPLGTSDALALERDGRLLMLVPAPEIGAEHREEAARDLFTATADVADVDLAGVAFPAPDGLPAAVARALPLLDLGLARGAVGVLLVGEAAPAATRTPSGLRTPPRDLLHELAEWPTLIDTLRELYRRDAQLGRTADALGVSRRTLTRRLERIRLVTGLDPVSGPGRHRFLAALSPAPTTSRPA